MVPHQQRAFPAFQGRFVPSHPLHYPRLPALYPHHRPTPPCYHPLPAYHPYAPAPQGFLPPFPDSQSQDEFLPLNSNAAPIHPNFYYAPDHEVFYYAPPHDDGVCYLHGPDSAAPSVSFLPSARHYESRRPLAHYPLVWMQPDAQGTDEQAPPEYVYSNNPTPGPRRIARPALIPVNPALASDFRTSHCNCGHQKPTQFPRSADDSDSSNIIPAGALPASHRNGVPIFLVPATPEGKQPRDKDSKTQSPQMGACDLPRKPLTSPSTREIPVIPAVNESINYKLPVMFTLDGGSQNRIHAVGNQQPQTKLPLQTQRQVAAGKPQNKMPPPAKTRSFDEETAAVYIQSLFRGHLVRRSEPLRHLGALSKVNVKLEELRARMSDPDVVAKFRQDKTERARFAESIMALLLQLDAIQGAHPFVRDRRKAVAKKLIHMQDSLDSLDLGSTPSASPKINTNGQDVPSLTEHDPRHTDDSSCTNASSTNANVVAENYSGDSTVLDKKEILVNGAADNWAEPTADTQCSPVRSQSAMESETQVSLPPPDLVSRDEIAKAAERNEQGLVESREAPFWEVRADESAVNSSFQLDTTVNSPDSPLSPAIDIDLLSKVPGSFNEDQKQQEEDRNEDVLQQGMCSDDLSSKQGMHSDDLTSKPCKCADNPTSKQPNKDILHQGMCSDGIITAKPCTGSDDHSTNQPNGEEMLKMGLSTQSEGRELTAQHQMESFLETKVEHESLPRNLSTSPSSNGEWENSEEESGLENEQNQDMQCSKECEIKPPKCDVQGDVGEQVKEMNLEQEEAAMTEPQVNVATRDGELNGYEDVKDTLQNTWQQLMQENMKLNLLVEKLVQSSHGQAAAIMQLNERVGRLEQCIVLKKVCRKTHARVKSCNGRRRK